MAGTTIKIGGRQFDLLPLRLKAWRELTAAGHTANLGKTDAAGLPTKEAYEAIAAFVAAGIAQVCPELGNVQWVEENLEPSDAELVLPVIMKRRSAASPGEAGSP